MSLLSKQTNKLSGWQAFAQFTFIMCKYIKRNWIVHYVSVNILKNTYNGGAIFTHVRRIFLSLKNTIGISKLKHDNLCQFDIHMLEKDAVCPD